MKFSASSKINYDTRLLYWDVLTESWKATPRGKRLFKLRKYLIKKYTRIN